MRTVFEIISALYRLFANTNNQRTLFRTELASEHRLSMLQFRGLFEHLHPDSGKRAAEARPDSNPRPKSRPKRVSLDGIAALRKKDAIIRSGGYERDPFVPPKGKGEGACSR